MQSAFPSGQSQQSDNPFAVRTNYICFLFQFHNTHLNQPKVETMYKPLQSPLNSMNNIVISCLHAIDNMASSLKNFVRYELNF
jgi:hypothetical protein